MPDEREEGLAEIGVLITLRQELGKSLDRDERILDLVRHAGGKRAETGEAIAAADLHLESLQRGDIGQHHERAERLAILPVENRTARAQDRVLVPGAQDDFAILLALPAGQRLGSKYRAVLRADC